MRTGRYSYNAQQRSIVRPIKRVQKLAEGFAQNYDCAVICHEKKEIVSEAMMTISAKEDVALAFYRACNTVFAQRGCTKLVNVSFLWPEDSEEESPKQTYPEGTYILNTNTHRFHLPSCDSVEDMKLKNRWDFTGTREEAIALGYKPCKRCNP